MQRRTILTLRAAAVMAVTGVACDAFGQSAPTQSDLTVARTVITQQLTADQRAALGEIAAREGKSPERLLWTLIGTAKLDIAKPAAGEGTVHRSLPSNTGNEDRTGGAEESTPSNTGNEDTPKQPQ